MISLLFAGAFITSTQSWRSTEDCDKMNDCAIRCRARTTNGLNSAIITTRNDVIHRIFADLKCVLRKMESDKEDVSSFTHQQHEIFMQDTMCEARMMTRYRYIVAITIGSHGSGSNFKTWRIEWKIWYRLTCPWRCRNSNGRRIVARRSVTSARNHSTHESVIIAILPYNFVIKEIVTAYDGRVDVLTKEKYILFMKNFKISQKNLEIASNYDLSIRTSSLVLV